VRDTPKEPFYPYAAFLFTKLPIYTEYSGVKSMASANVLARYAEAMASKPPSFWALRTGQNVDGDEHVKKLKETTNTRLETVV